MIRYLYTLTYPEKPTELVEDSKSIPERLLLTDHGGFGQGAIDPEEVAHDLDEITLNAAPETAVESPFLNEDDSRAAATQDSPQVRAEPAADQSAALCDASIIVLDQDLQVYVLGDKYGIPDLKKKAAQHFEKVLENADLTVEVFSIIGGVYSTTIPQDRGLRDIVTARIYGEIQHWIRDEEFTEMLRREGEFAVDLLSYTVKESVKQHEAILATIQHPGYCNNCQATLVVKRWISKRKNVAVKKYCARCEPWQ